MRVSMVYGDHQSTLALGTSLKVPESYVRVEEITGAR